MLSVKKQRMCLLALDFVLMSSIFVGVAGGFHATKTKEQETKPLSMNNVKASFCTYGKIDIYGIKNDMATVAVEDFAEYQLCKIEEEKQKQEEAAKREAEISRSKAQRNSKISLGEFKITFYSDDEKDQENWVGQTSTGAIPTVDRTIAVDPSIIPYGSIVEIEGLGVYIAEDCGGAIKNNKIDVFVSSYKEACKLGVQHKDVWIVEKGEN